MNAARKDAELYLRRCKELEAVVADLLTMLETLVEHIAQRPDLMTGYVATDLPRARAAIAKAKGEA